MLYELFLAGSFWFYTLFLFVPSLIIIAFLEVDDDPRPVQASMTLIGFMVAVHMFSNFSIIPFVQGFWKFILLGLLAYGIIGFVWGVFKWKNFLIKKHSRYLKDKKKFLDKHKLDVTDIPPAFKEEWEGSIGSKYNVIPRAEDNKERIISWMTFWPWSFLWFLLNDPIKWFYNTLYYYAADLFQSMANRQFKDINKDLPES